MNPILIALAAGLCWGIGEVFTKSVLHSGRIGPITAICVRSTVALPVLWCAYYIFVTHLKTEPARWLSTAGTTTLSKLVLGSGLLAGAAGMILFYLALSVGDVSRVKPIAFSVAPATAVVLGCLVLGEPITARKIVAVCLVLAGVVLMTSSK